MSPAYPQTLPVLRAEASPIAVLRDLTRMLLLLLVFTIPWEDQFVIGGLWTVSRIVGIATFAVGMLAVIADGRLRVPRPIHLVLGIFAVWIGLTAFWSINLDFTIYVLQTWAQLIALLWVIFEFAPARGDQIGLLRAYVLGTCVSAVGTLISYAQESSAYWERSVARGFDPNDLCVILVLSIPMSFYLMAVDSKGFRVWLWRLHPALILAAAVLTASRGGFIALCGAALIVPLLFRAFSFDTKNAMAMGVVLVLAGLLLYSPATSLERIASIPQEVSGGSFGERGAIWRAGWEIFQAHPVAGAGIGAFATAVSSILGEAIVAHNAFLTVLVETGLVGFVLFAGALCLMVGRIRRLEWIERRFWSVILLTWFLGAMSLSWAHRKPTWLLFGMIAAAGQSAWEKRK